jgi:hypothetical protein
LQQEEEGKKEGKEEEGIAIGKSQKHYTLQGKNIMTKKDILNDPLLGVIYSGP